jgi:DUF1680 family protein
MSFLSIFVAATSAHVPPSVGQPRHASPSTPPATCLPALPPAGVYLYLLPLGTGNTKGDNYHGWGSPTGSFWCCYGTAVESFAKLADSIYFQEAATGQEPVLYVNQYVSSKVSWAATGVGLAMRATYFGAGGGGPASWEGYSSNTEAQHAAAADGSI